MPLGQKGDWVVMAAWLVQLRARLLLPADAPAQQEAAAEADVFRGRLVALEDIQALAGWLERRPQLGHDVFARGQPEIFGVSVEAGQAIDVVEFLWASLALFDDDTAAADTATVYQARPFELYAVAEARERILQRLAQAPDGGAARAVSAGPGRNSGTGGTGEIAASVGLVLHVYRRVGIGQAGRGGAGAGGGFRAHPCCPGLSPRPRSPWPQPAGSVVLRSGVRTLPVPAQTGQVTRLPPTTSTPGWPACR